MLLFIILNKSIAQNGKIQTLHNGIGYHTYSKFSENALSTYLGKLLWNARDGGFI